MSVIISSWFFVVIIIAVHADRDIIASPEVCDYYPNEEFVIDMHRCQNTCEQYGRTWDCPGYKPYGDCYCKKGFARLTEDGNCVSVHYNAKCKAKLPITPDACRPDEYYTDQFLMGSCDLNTCLTYGCRREYTGTSLKWGPHCECSSGHKRLKNGDCVAIADPLCVAEYKPSGERCTAIGQIYLQNAPCQMGCHGIYCPPKSGTCVCPANTFAYEFVDYSFHPDYYLTSTTTDSSGNTDEPPIGNTLQACCSIQNCPTTTPASTTPSD